MVSRPDRLPDRPPGAAGGNNLNDVLRRIIVDGDAEELVKFAEQKGEELSKELKASQIRKFFAEVRRLGDEARVSQQSADLDRIYRRLTLLRPKLAYQAARQIAGVRKLQEVLDPAIQLVTADRSNPQRLTRFVELFEAMLAYHKFYGGQD